MPESTHRMVSPDETAVDTSIAHRRARWIVQDEPGAATHASVGIIGLEAGYEQSFEQDGAAEHAIVVLDGEVILRAEGGERPVSEGNVIVALRGASYGLRAEGPAKILSSESRPASPAGRSVSPERVLTADVRVARLEDVPAVAFHFPERGLFHMVARPFLTAATAQSTCMYMGQSTFAPGKGEHVLHRHGVGEFVYVTSGSGVHLAQDGEFPMGPGDLSYIPAGAWHGFRSAGSSPTELVYGYLGVATAQDAGQELKP